MNDPAQARRSRGVLAGMLAVGLVAVGSVMPVTAAERHVSEATGLAFDVPDGWELITHGAPDEHGHEDEEAPHADAIPHHALANYAGIAEGDSPATAEEAVIELGALPNAFLCDATLGSPTGAMEATYAYFATQLELPAAPAAYTMAIGNGIAVSAVDLAFGELGATWIAWPAGDDVTAWAFVGSVGSAEPHAEVAWEVAASLEVEVSGEEMAAMFADFAPDDACAGVPDTATRAGQGSQPVPPLSLMGLAMLTLAALLARERLQRAERHARRRRELEGRP